MSFAKENLLLYAVTDSRWAHEWGISLFAQIQDAIDAGVSCVQLREKHMKKDEFLAEAVSVAALCKSKNIPFIVNDNVEVALLAGADGVHVGQKDMSITDVRALVGKGMVIGATVHNVLEARVAQESGADYLGAGAVFSTATKEDARVCSIQMLCDICEAVSIPVVAIGGITHKNMQQLEGSGISGVAVVSAIFAQTNTFASVAKLKKEATRLFK